MIKQVKGLVMGFNFVSGSGFFTFEIGPKLELSGNSILYFKENSLYFYRTALDIMMTDICVK